MPTERALYSRPGRTTHVGSKGSRNPTRRAVRAPNARASARFRAGLEVALATSARESSRVAGSNPCCRGRGGALTRSASPCAAGGGGGGVFASLQYEEAGPTVGSRGGGDLCCCVSGGLRATESVEPRRTGGGVSERVSGCGPVGGGLWGVG